MARPGFRHPQGLADSDRAEDERAVVLLDEREGGELGPQFSGGDTTLNPGGGVRIGTAEIYRRSSCAASWPRAPTSTTTSATASATGSAAETSPRHVPRHILAVPDIPYTISGKKVEKAVRQIIDGEPVSNRDALANPEALERFAELFPPSS